MTCSGFLFCFVLTMNVVEVIWLLRIWFHSLEILDVPFFIRSFYHNFSPKSLGLKKVLLSGHRSHSGGRSSVQLRFLAPYLLVAAHSNPLINFPEGILLFEFPSSLMNCIPDLSNIPSNYSVLHNVLLENNQGRYFHACLSDL